MLAIICSTCSIQVSSGLNESTLDRDLERPSLAEEGRDLERPLRDFLFNVLPSPPLSGEKRLALLGRMGLCSPVEREFERGGSPSLSVSPFVNRMAYIASQITNTCMGTMI